MQNPLKMKVAAGECGIEPSVSLIDDIFIADAGDFRAVHDNFIFFFLL